MAGMQQDYHRWHSSRLGRDMGVVVYGHYGPPMLVFPTSGGDEWEHQGQGMIGTLAPFIEAGKIKIFTIAAVTNESFFDENAHPLHRAWVQQQYDGYVRDEVVPFIHAHCQGPLPITTMGASLGAYHAANTLFKHPDVVKRCYALSGVYDIKRFMDGQYNDHVYFNNPVDYLEGLSDPWLLGQLATCDPHIATGTGPWEQSGPSYQLAGVLRAKGIPCSLDDWGPQGGHDWPYWHHQMWTYVNQAF
jgi:esterase/lipase superfamily enzyme